MGAKDIAPLGENCWLQPWFQTPKSHWIYVSWSNCLLSWPCGKRSNFSMYLFIIHRISVQPPSPPKKVKSSNHSAKEEAKFGDCQNQILYPKNQLGPSQKRGVWTCFSQGSVRSPVPTCFEIPWFLGFFINPGRLPCYRKWWPDAIPSRWRLHPFQWEPTRCWD